jgi:adenylate cyclase class 2
MKTEIEGKFLNVDFDQLRQKLTSVGAIQLQPMRLMRRSIVETPELEAKNAFLRVRDEGDKVTLTYKQVDEDSLTGVKEIEVTASSFDDTVALLRQVGLTAKSFQESRRETWQWGDVEVVLDEWPWLNPYIEIEGESEADVKVAAQRLGFDWSEAVFGRVTSAYQVQYPNGDASKLVSIPRVAFGEPIPEIISGQKV